MNRSITNILKDQKAYYQRRAGEYDEWFQRQGRYDRGPQNNAAWFSEIDQIKKALTSCQPLGNVLEIAGGTGQWTGLLKEYSTSVHVIDSSPEVLEMNRKKNGTDHLTYEVADVFDWSPHRQFDFVFFSFWMSHVPEEKFAEFWALVSRCLNKSGKWFLIDSRPDEFSRAIDHSVNEDSDIVKRKLNDGTEFEIVKRFYNVEDLGRKLLALGWESDLSITPRFFIFGSGQRAD